MQTKHSLTTAGNLATVIECVILLCHCAKQDRWLARDNFASHTHFRDITF
jgi:hypothetical protein